MLTLQLGLPPQYVLDEMQMFEVKALLKYGYYKHRDDWEIGRLICYILAQVNSKKRLKLTDIMNFEWDKETADKEAKKTTKEDFERLKTLARQYEKHLQNNS